MTFNPKHSASFIQIRKNEGTLDKSGGMFLIIALFYLVAAYYNLTVIYWTTVFGRSFVLLSFAGLVIAKKSHPMLLLFGVIDALGAVWTLIALL